jgi:hypothetical protein
MKYIEKVEIIFKFIILPILETFLAVLVMLWGIWFAVEKHPAGWLLAGLAFIGLAMDRSMVVMGKELYKEDY